MKERREMKKMRPDETIAQLLETFAEGHDLLPTWVMDQLLPRTGREPKVLSGWEIGHNVKGEPEYLVLRTFETGGEAREMLSIVTTFCLPLSEVLQVVGKGQKEETEAVVGLGEGSRDLEVKIGGRSFLFKR